jgi:tetratricopeptide (TPR) repeat protein
MNTGRIVLMILFYAMPLHAAAQTVDQLTKTIAATENQAEQSKLSKQLGEQLVQQDKIAEAADAFSKALALGRDQFTVEDRVQMAIYLSWADRLAESRDELQRVLVREPKNIAARTHLARVLSWSGNLTEALDQADLALAEMPDHKEALLVKADALQWQGRYPAAIPIYQRLAGGDGDFEARAGLARSMLAVGNRTGALASRDALRPASPRQQNELAKLTDAIDQETSPAVDTRYNYYRDSDRNRLNRYSLSGSFWLDNQRYGFDYRRTDARDRSRDNRGDDFLARIYSRLTDSLAAGAGIGFTRLDGVHSSNFPAGHVRLDARLFAGKVGASVTREVLTDTAELIDNRIRMTNVGLYATQPVTERFGVHAGYNYRSFSDGNHANDLQLVSQYAVWLAPRVLVGHRFRLLDFHKQSGSGFFDPNNYIANRAFSSLYYETRRFYTYLEAYVGYQTFRRNGIASDDFIQGGAGSVGVKPMSNVAIEVNVEGGNFAAGSTSGFNYFVVGPRILFRF